MPGGSCTKKRADERIVQLTPASVVEVVVGAVVELVVDTCGTEVVVVVSFGSALGVHAAITAAATARMQVRRA